MTQPQLIARNSDPRQWAAMSFVHLLGRLHVAASEIVSVEAEEFSSFTVGGVRISSPHVAVELSASMCEQLYAMTSAIMASDQSEVPFSIWVGRRCVVQPILREPIGASPVFHISTFTMEEANKQALMLKSRVSQPSLAVVGCDHQIR